MKSYILKEKFIYLSAFFILCLCSIKLDFENAFVSMYILALFTLIFYQLQYMRTMIKEIFIDTCIRDDSPINKFAKGRVFACIFSVIPAILISVSISVLMYRATYFDIAIILVMSIFYYKIYKFIDVNFKKHFNPSSKEFIQLTVSFLITTMMMSFSYYLLHFFEPVIFKLASPDIVDHVINEINHKSIIFRNIVRTSYYIDINIYTSKNIPGYGKYIFPLLYSATASAIPFSGIALTFQYIIKKINN